MSKRSCPICLEYNNELLFRQDFATYSQGSLMDGYSIVHCKTCGGIYADNIPEQADFDRYYETMSKYERHGGRLSKIDKERFGDIADKLMSYMLVAGKPAAIADWGGATGGLLSEFKARGCSYLINLEPSKTLSDLAIARGLKSFCHSVATLTPISPQGERFDLLLCTSVLEHIRDVNRAVANFAAILANHGRLYLEVPDVTRYHEVEGSGFALFSMEHINYFSRASLKRLLDRHGLQIDWMHQIDRKLSEASLEPTLSVLCSFKTKQEHKDEEHKDEESLGAVLTYIRESKEKEHDPHVALMHLAETKIPLIVWGAGTHTLRMMKTSMLKDCNIECFVDSNKSYQGKMISGIPIIDPEALRRIKTERSILISSQISQAEIHNQLTEMGYPFEKIIKLYP